MIKGIINVLMLMRECCDGMHAFLLNSLRTRMFSYYKAWGNEKKKIKKSLYKRILQAKNSKVQLYKERNCWHKCPDDIQEKSRVKHSPSFTSVATP